MSTQNERQADRRQESRCYGEFARIRAQGFRDRQSDELVEFFLPHSLKWKSDIAKADLGGVNQDRTDPKSLTSFALFPSGPQPFLLLPFSRQSLRVQRQLPLQPQLVLLRLL